MGSGKGVKIAFQVLQFIPAVVDMVQGIRERVKARRAARKAKRAPKK